MNRGDLPGEHEAIGRGDWFQTAGTLLFPSISPEIMFFCDETKRNGRRVPSLRWPLTPNFLGNCDGAG